MIKSKFNFLIFATSDKNKNTSHLIDLKIYLYTLAALQ